MPENDQVAVANSAPENNNIIPQWTFKITDIAIFPPLCASYAILLSTIYTIIFFYKIGIDQLTIPLTISDYTMSFSTWLFPLIYTFLCTAWTLFIKKILISFKSNSANNSKNLKRNTYYFILVLIYFMHPYIIILGYINFFHEFLSVAFAIIILALIFIISVIIFYMSSIEKIYSNKYNTTIAIIIISTTISLIAFPTFANLKINQSLQYTQKLDYRDKKIKVSLLRSLDKGLLVYTTSEEYCPDLKPRILFLPYDKGPTLTFSTGLSQEISKLPLRKCHISFFVNIFRILPPPNSAADSKRHSCVTL